MLGQGVRYFKCMSNYGGFVRPAKVFWHGKSVQSILDASKS